MTSIQKFPLLTLWSAVVILTLAACDYLPSASSDDLTGKWVSDEDGTGMVFHEDGAFELLDKDGRSILDTSNSIPMWQAVTEIVPHQLYMLAKMENETKRMPMGIYKIEGDKLVLRQVKTYNKTISGIPVGEPRYEMPTDFSGIVTVLTRQ